MLLNFCRIAPVTTGLLLVSVVAFLGLHEAGRTDLLMHLAVWPAHLEFRWWQLLTYALLHGSLSHLLFNIIALLGIGGMVEIAWGSRRYALYLLVCVIAGGLVQAFTASAPTVGMSAGIFGLLVAWAYLFPNQRVWLLIPPVPMSPRVMLALVTLMSCAMIIAGWMPHVAHLAHLAGAASAAVLIRWRAMNWPVNPLVADWSSRS